MVTFHEKLKWGVRSIDQKVEKVPIEAIENFFKFKNSKGQKGTYLKVIVTGSVIEIYEHENLPTLPSAKKKTKDMTKEEFEEKYGDFEYDNRLTDRKNNQHKSRNEFRRVVTANFDAGSKFITLTMAEDIRDVTEGNKLFDRFLKRLRYKYGNFKFIKVIQFQDENRDGVVHYHMISDLPYIPHKELEKIWGHGWVGINRIDHVDNVGAYLTPYLNKDMTDPRLMGKKSWSSSHNLERPQEFVGDEAEMIIKALELENKKTVYSSHYTTTHLGHALYKQFNLKRD